MRIKQDLKDFLYENLEGIVDFKKAKEILLTKFEYKVCEVKNND